jgi:hypothetical protein
MTAADNPNPAVPNEMDQHDWYGWVNTLTAQQRADYRTNIVVAGLHAGLTLDALGEVFGVTRERIRQIAATQGINTSQLRAEQKYQAKRRRQRFQKRIYDASRTHPELEIGELAEWFDTDKATVRKALGHRRAVHEALGYESTTRTSKADLITALQTWAAETDVFTGDSYTEWAERHNLPGKQTPMMRFGGWNNALLAAGLDRLIVSRGGLRPHITDETMWASVVEFYRADLPSYSAASYDTYARERGLASLASVRVRLGQWNEIKPRVRALLRYAANRDGSWDWGESVLGIDPSTEPRNVSTREESLESLKAVAARTHGPLTVQAYESARRSDETPANTVMLRCGTWAEALVDAGLSERMSTKARFRYEQIKDADSAS